MSRSAIVRPDLSQFNLNISSIHPPAEEERRAAGAEPGPEADAEADPPLLEELGVDLGSVAGKLRALALLGRPSPDFISRPDMVGPVLLGTLLGLLLTLRQKLSFGYIYGFGFFGALAVYYVLNLMLRSQYVPLYSLMSLLGYCLAPLLPFSAVNLFVRLNNAPGLLCCAAVAALTTALAIRNLGMLYELGHRRLLVAYPIFLFYLTFVVLIIS